MNYLKIRNWDRWQSYRADRGQPPWIKLHRRLLKDPDWFALSEHQKGQLVSLWLLAAERDGKIPDDQKVVMGLCGLSKPPDLDFFVSHGFIEERRQGDAKVTPTRRQVGVTVQVSSVQDSTEKRAPAKADAAPSLEILEYLNKITGRTGSHQFTNTKEIQTCLKREKCSVEDCKLMLSFKWDEWKDTEYATHVNPITPFRPKHFAGYLDAAKAGPPKKEKILMGEEFFNELMRQEEAGENA